MKAELTQAQDALLSMIHAHRHTTQMKHRNDVESVLYVGDHEYGTLRSLPPWWFQSMPSPGREIIMGCRVVRVQAASYLHVAEAP